MLLDIDLIKFKETNTEDIYNNIFQISLSEKLDQFNMNTFEILMLTLIKGGVRKIVFNMKNLKYIDSSGIGKMINIAKIIRKTGGNLTITQCNEKIYEIFKLVKLDTFIKFFLTNEEGANYLQFL